MLQAFSLSAELKLGLKKRIEQGPGETRFRQAPELASLVACLGMHQEIGGVNDELHRHLLDAQTSSPPPLSSMKSEVVTFKGRFGLRIFSTQSTELELTHPQLQHLIHPEFSHDEDGRLTQLVIFPQTVAEIVALQEVEAVIVKDWALNTVFGGFNPQERFYVTNDWEIRQNDGLKMTQLLAKRKLAFSSTHDLVAHIAGVDGRNWEELQKFSEQLLPVMSSANSSAITHLVIPYIIGVLLDDLAQPAHAGSPQRIKTILHLAKLQQWALRRIPAKERFREFPKAFSALIEEARQSEFTVQRLQELGRLLSIELQISAAGSIL